MINSLDALVFSLHSARGVYALLLGSGLSRPAGIPTGWEIIEDLIRRIAHARGQDVSGSPVEWYKSLMGEEPKYSKILEEMASSRAERQAILRLYFEPTEEELEQGSKVPTKAHRAIARLARNQVVRVILTTNFDRLLEAALADEGVIPTVLSTPEAMEGAPPLVHTGCTVIKLHGDYLDTRIKNTEAELLRYDRRQNRLLRQIFDEYGLIVCGWSARWDRALFDSLASCKNQRYTTFWAARRGRLTTEAEQLVQLRRARMVPIEDADSFFESVADRLEALQEFDRPHPMSKQIALAQLKSYLPEERHRIRLHDLVWDETEKVRQRLIGEHYPLSEVAFDATRLKERLGRYEADVEILESLLAVGAYWSRSTQDQLWLKVLERIGTPEPLQRYNRHWAELRWYPATRLLYSAGIGALHKERYDCLWKLLSHALIREQGREPEALSLRANAWCIEQETLNAILGRRWSSPGSVYLAASLRETLRPVVPDDQIWEVVFDRFEYFLGLATAKISEFPFIGKFGSTLQYGGGVAHAVAKEIETGGQDWPPLRAGFFDGSLEDLQSAVEAVSKNVDRTRWY